MSNYERQKTNPFIEDTISNQFPNGEYMLPLNPYTNAGYVIYPYYFVTNYGRIFSVAKGYYEEKALQTNTSGYAEIGIMTTAGQKHLLVHRAVLSTFFPRADMYNLQVDHINGNHFDNRVENLRWVTGLENVRAARDTGIISPRSRVLSDDDIIRIMDLVKQGKTDEEVEQILLKDDIRVAAQTVRIIRTGQSIYGEILDRLRIEPVIHRQHTHLTEDDYERIRYLFIKCNLNSSEIAEEMGIASKTVRALLLKWYGDNYSKVADRSTLTMGQKTPIPSRRNKPFAVATPTLSSLGSDVALVNINTSKLHVINPCYYVSKDGKVFTAARGNTIREMRQYTDKKGYANVGLETDHGNKQFRVHRLILATFNPRPDMYDLEVDHVNGIRDDNRLENLNWVTGEENMQRASAIGITALKTPQRAPDEDIVKIVTLAHNGKSDAEISAIMNGKYTPNNVNIIRTGSKTYGPVLEKLGLQPYKQHTAPIPQETKKAIKDYIDSRLSSGLGLMALYEEAGAKFNVNSGTVRKIYSS